ncbi:TlpA family protein disulfide reductase [Motiliproteus coralliicola]|nr:TlpA family protein disulfide reductase [Motiliproteus coralliicola]
MPLNFHLFPSITAGLAMIQPEMIKRCATLLLASLLMIGLAGCSSEAETETGPSIADVVLPDLDGKPQSFQQYAGKTLVVNLWATWCAPCVKEMPALQRLSEALDPARFVVVGVNVDQQAEPVKGFLVEHGISFPQLSDAKMAFASDTLGVNVYPYTLIVDPQGMVQQRILGPREWDDPDYYQDLLALD